MDSSSSSFKGVLLHNGNRLPSIPVFHSSKQKESYESVQTVMNKINYKKYEWRICGDFKMIQFVLGQQQGYTKYQCFLCLWNSRDDASHWKTTSWSTRGTLKKGDLNITNEPLVQPNKIIIPPLHIKLGLMSQFVKKMKKDSQSYLYFKKKFP